MTESTIDCRKECAKKAYREPSPSSSFLSPSWVYPAIQNSRGRRCMYCTHHKFTRHPPPAATRTNNFSTEIFSERNRKSFPLCSVRPKVFSFLTHHPTRHAHDGKKLLVWMMKNAEKCACVFLTLCSTYNLLNFPREKNFQRELFCIENIF